MHQNNVLLTRMKCQRLLLWLIVVGMNNLLTSLVVPCHGLEEPQIPISRRRREVLLLGGGSLSLMFPKPALAARGAAELDLEYYMRDVLGGNQRGGTVMPSKPPPIKPPRVLQQPKLVSLLLDEDCTPACIPVQALMQQLLQKKSTTKADADMLAQDIQSRVQVYKERTRNSFLAKAPWQQEIMADQYYFDFTSYCLWRVAADLLPNYVDRDQFVRTMGTMLYDRLLSDKLLRIPPPSSSSSTTTSLVDTLPAVLEVLRLFESSQFCKGFRIRGSDEDSEIIFDELDDDSLQSGGTVNALVSVYEPATLGASLQITGEQSRFGPDLVGPTVAALWDQAGIRSSWETFFVDPEYRPNPKDYFPNEQLLQYTLSSKK